MIFPISHPIDELDIVGGKPQEWWLYGPTLLRGPSLFLMTLRALPILIIAGASYWATEAHPNWAVILTIPLLDFVIVTRGRRLLRLFVTYMLVCVFYAALGGPHWRPTFFSAALSHPQTAAK